MKPPADALQGTRGGHIKLIDAYPGYCAHDDSRPRGHDWGPRIKPSLCALHLVVGPAGKPILFGKRQGLRECRDRVGYHNITIVICGYRCRQTSVQSFVRSFLQVCIPVQSFSALSSCHPWSFGRFALHGLIGIIHEPEPSSRCWLPFERLVQMTGSQKISRNGFCCPIPLVGLSIKHTFGRSVLAGPLWFKSFRIHGCFLCQRVTLAMITLPSLA